MTAATRLIVHADDFGLDEPVNLGIVDAHDHGIVTSVSLMATGSAFDHAVTLALGRPKLDVGVHLVLTEHRPLTGAAVPTLVDSDGRFAPHATRLARKRLRGSISLDEVRAELDAQIRRVRATGLPVSHLDGHQHVHVLPGIAGVVAELAAEHGIAAVRYPAESVRSYMLRDPRRFKRVAEQVALAAASAVSPLKGLRRSDDFVGFYFGGRLDEANLARVLAGLPAGRTVELMCHPGAEGVHADDWQYAWVAERDALMSPRIRELVAAQGIELVSYRDV